MALNGRLKMMNDRGPTGQVNALGQRSHAPVGDRRPVDLPPLGGVDGSGQRSVDLRTQVSGPNE